MKVRRPTNPHDIRIEYWQITHTAGDRASVRADIDIPMMGKLGDINAMHGVVEAIARHLDECTKSRARRVWEAITR